MSHRLRNFLGAAVCVALVIFAAQSATAQRKKPPAKRTAQSGPIVTQIDIDGLKTLLKPNGKPLLVNFWATWCDPCREEFPDLVRLDAAYKGKIDFVTVTLDEPSDIKTIVAKFLRDMKATMPAYLLATADPDAAVTFVSKDWAGNLPMTVLFKPDGSKAYERNGKVRYETLAVQLDKLLKPVEPITSQ